jgi:hypothetical protein
VDILDNSQATPTLLAPAPARERRATPRYAFSASAEAVNVHADTRLSGRVSDLGRGGCFVDTINPFPVGAEIKIRIVKDNLSFLALGKVLYATDGFGMGLGFTKVEPEKQTILNAWLAELSGESPRELKTLDDDLFEKPTAASSGNELRNVLNELIVTLIRKNVLTDPEGKALLKKLME